MNISSVIINLKNESFLGDVLTRLKNVSECEVVTSQNTKIIAVITADDVNAEVAKFREIEAIDGVGSVAMVYAYQEDIEFDKDKLDIGQDVAEILQNETIRAEDIVYNGHVGAKVK